MSGSGWVSDKNKMKVKGKEADTYLGRAVGGRAEIAIAIKSKTKGCSLLGFQALHPHPRHTP